MQHKTYSRFTVLHDFAVWRPLPCQAAKCAPIQTVAKENAMSFDYLRKFVSAQLEQRVAAERQSLCGTAAAPADCEAYFKEVFAGQIF